MPITKRFLDIMRDKLNTNNQIEIVNIWIERIRLGIFLENYNGKTAYSVEVNGIEPFTLGLLEKEISETFTDGVDVRINQSSEGVFVHAIW